MDILKPWIYIDNEDNIWKFSVNSENELQYTIIHKDRKWTDEKTIDKDVLGYCVYADRNGIHIIYSNMKAELKYCTFIGQQWMGKTIYNEDEENVEMTSLNVILTNEWIHIFYLLKEKMSNGHGILMHCKWDGRVLDVRQIQDIIMASTLNEHYLVYLDGKSNIEMLFFTDEGNEVSLNQCSYRNRKWSNPVRLYGISGDDIEIKVLKEQYGIHFINKYEENSVYYLVHVFIKNNGDVLSINVHKSNNILSDIILLKEGNKISTYWIEKDNNIYSSFFEGEVWSEPICVIENSEHKVKSYKYIEPKYINQIKEVYWIGGEDINLILLGGKEILQELKIDSTEESEELHEKEIFKKDDDIETISIVRSLKSENELLKDTIVSLQAQLQNKQNLLKEYEEEVSKVILHKKKAEENYDIFIEVQNKLQNELEELKKLYTEEKLKRESAEIQLKEMKEEEDAIKEQINKLIEVKDNLLEEKNKLIEENNKLIKDNDTLNKEIEELKNKSSRKGLWKF